MNNLVSIPIVRSSFLVLQPDSNGTIAYHSLHGQPLLLNGESTAFLDLFSAPRTLKDVRRECIVEDDERWLKYYLRRHFLRRADHDERASFRSSVARAVAASVQPKEFMSLGLVVDEGCNFDCQHCVAKKLIAVTSRKNAQHRRMSWPVAHRAIDTFVRIARKRGHHQVEIYFGGSEPLLNWRVIEQTILYCSSTYGRQIAFTYSTNSNASLITPERSKFLSKHRVSVTTSIDGMPAVNDRSRITNAGRGTYHRIMRGWDNLGRAGQPVTWCSLTLTDRNIDLIDETFFDWLVQRGIKSCTFENDLIAPLAKTPQEVVDTLMRFKEWGDQRHISVGGQWDKPLRNLFEPSLKKRLFNCSAFSGRGATVLPNGNLLLCVYSATELGTIDDLERWPDTPAFRQLATRRSAGNIPECQGCEIEGHCIGGCYLTPEYDQATQSQAAFLYRCEVYRGVTRALLQRAVGASSH